jgi:RNA polymerase sigma-70 factor, ECF subfamily
MTIEDSELNGLMAAVARGDKRSFKRVYDETAPKLYGVALRLLRRRDQAEEVLQEAFLSVWRNAGQYSAARGSAFVWLAMVVRNKALDRMRQTVRRPVEVQTEDLGLVALAVAGCDALTRIDEDGRDVRRCFQLLPERFRNVIGLAFFEGFTHEEMAEQLATPLGTVKAWVRKGLTLLKECLTR